MTKPMTSIILTLSLLFQSQIIKAGEIPLVINLQKTAQTAQQRQVPVVIFVSATWCAYCKQLKENILNPLFQTTGLKDYAEFRQLLLDKAHAQIKDFAGNKIEMKQYGAVLGVKVVPTTLFLNAKGEQIADPIIGLTLEEFYLGNLERSLNQALEALGNPKRLDIYNIIISG